MNDELLKKKVYSILVDRVLSNAPIYYGELYNIIGLDCSNSIDRKKGSHLLELANLVIGEKYMISSFAVSKDNNSPYDGFYKLANRWGRIKNNLSDDEKLKFWIDEMKSVHNKLIEENK